MADLSNFFDIEYGLSIEDQVTVFGGFQDPSAGAGEAAPVGSLFLRTNGTLYQKFGPLDNNWALFSAEGTSVKVTATDTTSGFLNDKLVVFPSLTKTIDPSFPANQTLQLDLSSTGVAAGTYTQVTLDVKGRATAAFNPTTLAGYGITDAQPLHPNLTALSSISSQSPPVGLYTVLASGISAARTIEGTTDEIQVINGDGVLGHPVISLIPNTVIPGTKGIRVPVGTQVQEMASPNGVIRYDTDLDKFRFRQNGEWLNFGADLLLYEENVVSPTLPTVTGQNAVAIGEGATASGQNSTAIGNSVAGSRNSTAIGNGSRTSSYGEVAFAGRAIGTFGSSQGAEYIYAGETITQFPIELFLDGIAERAVFSDPFTAVTMNALVIGQRVDIPGDLFSCRIEGQFFIADTPGSARFFGVKSQFGVSDQAMSASIVADTTNGTFNVIVQGLASQVWRWVVRVSTVQCIL